MALSVPETPKTKTKIYENFKGVDLTNDSTNVWYRRSPSGVNMLPDASGRPFKRKGWESVISAEDLLNALPQSVTADDTSILRCFYFELAGIDHIIIFTTTGVFKYAEETLTFLTGSDSEDCFASYDRAFFFEGDGKSAFYIYGNYKVWRYSYEDGFTFELVDAYIPTVLIGGDCNTGAGTVHEGYNLLGKKAAYQYYTDNAFAHFGSDGLVYTADETAIKTSLAQEGEYTYTYTTSWSPSLPNGLVVDGTPENGDFIKILYGKYVLLPINVSDHTLCKVYVTLSNGTKFGKSLNVAASGNPTADSCVLHTDNTSRENKQAWIQFNSTYTYLDGTEDAIKVVVPVTEITITKYPTQASTEVTGTASLIE